MFIHYSSLKIYIATNDSTAQHRRPGGAAG